MNVHELGSRLRGGVLSPDDPDFDEARSVWNARTGGRPDLIARCESAADVAAAVEFARREGLTLSVKGGAHSYAGKTVGDGGLLIDLSGMKRVRIDPAARIAWIEGGVTCGQLDRAAQQHGFATPTPTVSSVGVAGAALGGGSGYLSRKHGLTLDNLISVDLVTADGRSIRASEDENADLFWALRGAGSNFGVATSLQLRLHDVGPEVLAGQIIYPFDAAGDLLAFYRDFMARAPEDLQCYPFMFRIPPIDAFPAEHHGQPALDFVLCHIDAGAADVVRPLRTLGTPILDIVGPAAYTTVQQGFDANLPKGQRYESRGHDLDGLPDDVIDTVIAHVPDMRGVFTAAYFEPRDGAVGRIDPSATAFAGRRAQYEFHIIAGWSDATEDADVLRWTQTLHDAIAPHATGGVYVNILGIGEDARVPAAYGPSYARLAELKARWDPDNVFRANYNIPPARI